MDVRFQVVLFATTCDLTINVSMSDEVAVDVLVVFATLVAVLWVKVTVGLAGVHVMVMTSTWVSTVRRNVNTRLYLPPGIRMSERLPCLVAHSWYDVKRHRSERIT